jgi:hypothetical protein
VRAEVERTIVTGSTIPTTAEEVAQAPEQEPAPAVANRKLIRNATLELEIVSFDNAVQKITAFASDEHGFVATTDSEKQANGKLRGQVVVKVLPENLDRFLQRIRSLGELKNQTLGTDDVTKAYFDTDARLKNAELSDGTSTGRPATFGYRSDAGIHWPLPGTNLSTRVFPVSPYMRTTYCVWYTLYCVWYTLYCV